MNNETSDGGATVPSISLLGGPHRCDTCTKEFPTCDAVKIVWGIDRDPSARGANADKVLECDAYTPKRRVYFGRPRRSQAMNNNDSGPAVSSTRLLDAGSVAPSDRRYIVTWPHDHKTLKAGDVVVMTITPQVNNLLLRLSDMTLHGLTDEHDQYVHLGEASNSPLHLQGGATAEPCNGESGCSQEDRV